MQAWQDRADGVLVLARWALGASLVSPLAVVVAWDAHEYARSAGWERT
jgi:hypothetical protein